MRKRSPHVVGRTVPGAPPSVDVLRRFRAPPHRHARPTRVDGRRRFTAPTLPQPLSHAATRRDSSPFSGAEGWAEVRGVCASVYHDSDTYVLHPPVRGGVPDAPRSRDRRAALDASVRPDQPHPRPPRRARLASTAQRIQSRGHRPRTISYGRTNVIRQTTPGGRGSPPLR